MEHALSEDNSDDVDLSQLISTVVLAIGEGSWYPVVGGVDDQRLIDVLERALPQLTDPVHRGLLLALLALVRYYDDEPQRRVALSDEALAMVRPAADTVALARVLHLRAMALYGPDYPEQCLAATTELLELPNLPLPIMAASRLLRCWLLATGGRIAEVTAQLDFFVRFVEEQSCSPIYRVHLGWARACLLILAGRWAEADAVSRATCDLHLEMNSFSGPLEVGRRGPRAGHPDIPALGGGVSGRHRRGLGR